MKRTVRTMAVIAAVLAMSAPKSSAQTASIHADLMKDWSEMKDRMAKIAEAMPEGKFTYKATPPERSYGDQILHIAQANVRLLKSLGGKAPAPTGDMTKLTKKADIIKAMNDSFDYGTALIKEFNDQTILAPAPMAPQFLGPSTRARIVYSLLGHTWDIYGQMVVYLRLNGGVPPASQRP